MGHTEPSGLHASLCLGCSAGTCLTQAVPSASPRPCPLSLIFLPGSQEQKGQKEQAIGARLAWRWRGSGEAGDPLPVQEAVYQCVSSPKAQTPPGHGYQMAGLGRYDDLHSYWPCHARVSSPLRWTEVRSPEPPLTQCLWFPDDALSAS